MADTYYPIDPNPEYDPEVRELQDSDPARASTVFNPTIGKIVNNVAAVKKTADAASQAAEEAKSAAGNSDPAGSAAAVQQNLDSAVASIESQLDNMASKDDVRESIYTHDIDPAAHGDIRASIYALEGRTTNLEIILGGGISTNPFLITFADLDGVTVTGVWNDMQGRIEF